MSTYDTQIFEAFIQKQDKFQWYKKTFEKLDNAKSFLQNWQWSWWAFFGSFWFFLYRKTYISAIVLFVICAVASIHPILILIVFVLNGGFASHFIYKSYQTKRLKFESLQSDEKMRLALMKYNGGVNFWVIPVYIFFVAFSFLSSLFTNLPT